MQTLRLKLGVKVMITYNMDTSDGLNYLTSRKFDCLENSISQKFDFPENLSKIQAAKQDPVGRVLLSNPENLTSREI